MNRSRMDKDIAKYIHTDSTANHKLACMSKHIDDLRLKTHSESLLIFYQEQLEEERHAQSQSQPRLGSASVFSVKLCKLKAACYRYG